MPRILVVFDQLSRDKSYYTSGQTGLEWMKLCQEVNIPWKDMTFHEFFPKTSGLYKLQLNKTEAKKLGGVVIGECNFHPIVTDLLQSLEQKVRETNPDTILVVGRAAFSAITGEKSFTNWRGSMLYAFDKRKLMPVYQPADYFKQWHNRFIARSDLDKVAKNLGRLDWPELPENFDIVMPDRAEGVLRELIAKLDGAVERIPLAVDIETTRPFITTIGFATSASDAFTLPFETSGRQSVYDSADAESRVVLLVAQVLTHPKAYIIGQNYIYDRTFMTFSWGFVSNFNFDTMWAHHALGFMDLPKSLDFLSSMYLPFHRYWKDKSLHSGNTNYQEAWEYNCRDCCKTFALWQVLYPATQSVQHILDYQFSWHRFLFRAQLRGVRYDGAGRTALIPQTWEIIRKLGRMLEDMIPHSVMPRNPKTPFYKSPAQMCDLLYKRLGLPEKLNRTPEGAYVPSSDDAALTALMEDEPILKPFLHLVLTYRRFQKFYDTYLCAEISTDGRIRTSYDQAGTATFRLASRKDILDQGLNLQNIPDSDTIYYSDNQKALCKAGEGVVL